jgi:acyl-coenzyme A synthetase/AMP-(fatty) acid ligase
VKDPDAVYASVPMAEDLEWFEDITYCKLAAAVDHTCNWLDDALGSIKVFAYTGPNDLRYSLLIIAAAKTGRVIQLPGTGLPAEDVAVYLQTQDCKHLLHPAHSPTLERDAHLSVTHHTVPSLAFWLDAPAAPRYPFTKTWQENRHEIYMVVHTSGTTGRVKPIPYSHASWSTTDILPQLQVRSSSDPSLAHLATPYAFTAQRTYSPFTLAHGGGNMMNIFFPLYWQYVAVLGPASVRPNVDTAAAVLKKGRCTAMMSPPYLTAEIMQSAERGDCAGKEALAALVRLNWLATASAPLSKTVGDALVKKGVKLLTQWAMSETAIPLLQPLCTEQWDYISPHPANGIVFEPHDDGDGRSHSAHPDPGATPGPGTLYEAVWYRDPERSWCQQVFHIYPNLERFPTKDLFEIHPNKPGLWKYAGRVDDQITLTTWPSIHLRTTRLEWQMKEYRGVRDALVGGDGREGAFALVEVDVKTGMDIGIRREEMAWRAVEAANRLIVQSEAKIERTRVLVVDDEKAFVKTWKGSVDRRRTFELYMDDIDGLYCADTGTHLDGHRALHLAQ